MTKMYEPHNELVLQARFKDRDGALADPTVVTCVMRKPDGNEATLAGVASVSTGIYEVSYVPVQEGTHWYRYRGTGALTAQITKSFVTSNERVELA